MYYQLKIVMLGDQMVGKTSIRVRYTEGSFKPEYIKTFGADVSFKKVETSDQFSNVAIWDLDGNNDFTFLKHYYLAGSNGIVFVLDATKKLDRESLKTWVKELKDSVAYRQFAIAILVNKMDLMDQIQIESSEIFSLKQILREEFDTSNEYFENLDLKIFLTSAKNGEGIESAFSWIVSKAVKQLVEVNENAY